MQRRKSTLIPPPPKAATLHRQNLSSGHIPSSGPKKRTSPQYCGFVKRQATGGGGLVSRTSNVPELLPDARRRALYPNSLLSGVWLVLNFVERSCGVPEGDRAPYRTPWIRPQEGSSRSFHQFQSQFVKKTVAWSTSIETKNDNQ